MKKTVSLFLLFLLALGLVACTVGEAGQVTYTVTVLDSEGRAAAGVSVQLCRPGFCLMPVKTNEKGQMTFTREKSEDITTYYLTLEGLPEGHTAEERYTFGAGETALTIQLVKE